MAIISAAYAAAETALAKNTLMSAMMWRDQTCIDITLMSDEELAANKIATRDEAGRWVPDSSFMNAASRQFHRVNNWPGNAEYRYTGELFIGTVAYVILAEREKAHQTWREGIALISEHTGVLFGVPENATPRQLRGVFDQATDALRQHAANLKAGAEAPSSESEE